MSALTDSLNPQNFAIRTAFLNRTNGITSAQPKITDEDRRELARRRRIEDFQLAREPGITIDELGAL